ncbi:voltage-dependent calcium channel gamma-5 subunit-like isoform X2 [Rhodnius prolixus]|uniref:voltage-dependent calcium channel gamma-5 subunit-like isoform X2 n=1 Tax=Rhodnius prolixus TaxID=13249 RepID=UPI003D18F929
MCMRGVCSSGLAVGVGLVSLTALVTGFVSNVWLYTREPVSLPNNQPPTTITFRIGFWRVCPALNKTNYTIRLPSPSCVLVKYSSWDELKHSDIGVMWSPLEFTPSIITRMRVSMPFAAVAVLLLLMATLAALIGHCNNDHKTLIACALYTLAGLSLASGLVVFASVVSDVSLERPRRSSSPGFQYRYGWSFFSAGAAFVLAEVAAVLCITAYLRRFPTAEHMVRAVVPGAERKLLGSRNSDYGVRTPSEVNKELLVPSFEESLDGPLLTKPPDLCSTAQETQCQSCKKEQERQMAGTTVPITLGTYTLRPQRTTPAYQDYARRYATLGHTGILHAGVLGVSEQGGNWSSGSSPSSGSSCPRPPRKHHKPPQPPQQQPVI